ncbi:MAG: hypothetical protein D6715_06215 [Calditrichaeota bacterium]|nr:MAG: hypothetical protein D6715_06215 [Calditrichota bacterium]
MQCPYCNFNGHRMDLHAHLMEQHAEQVKVFVHRVTGKMMYEFQCPLCEEHWLKPLKKRPSDLQAYVREIRMVAFDLFLYHLMLDHGQDAADAENQDAT